MLNSSLLIKGLSFQKDLYLELANHPTDPKLIWKAVLGKLQLQVNKSSFETWLVSTAGHLLEDTSLTVSVPNNFVAEMLDQRMYSIISSAVQQVLKKDIDVNFIVVDPSMNAADPIATHARPNTAISSTVKPSAFYNKGWRTFKNFVVGDSNMQQVCPLPKILAQLITLYLSIRAWGWAKLICLLLLLTP